MRPTTRICTVLQAAGEAVPAHMTQLQRDVLQLASGDGRSTRYAMLANALLLLLAPLPTDITEQARRAAQNLKVLTVCSNPALSRAFVHLPCAWVTLNGILLYLSTPYTLLSAITLCCHLCRQRSTGWACSRAVSCRTRRWR